MTNAYTTASQVNKRTGFLPSAVNETGNSNCSGTCTRLILSIYEARNTLRIEDVVDGVLAELRVAHTRGVSRVVGVVRETAGMVAIVIDVRDVAPEVFLDVAEIGSVRGDPRLRKSLEGASLTILRPVAQGKSKAELRLPPEGMNVFPTVQESIPPKSVGTVTENNDKKAAVNRRSLSALKVETLAVVEITGIEPPHHPIREYSLSQFAVINTMSTGKRKKLQVQSIKACALQGKISVSAPPRKIKLGAVSCGLTVLDSEPTRPVEEYAGRSSVSPILQVPDLNRQNTHVLVPPDNHQERLDELTEGGGSSLNALDVFNPLLGTVDSFESSDSENKITSPNTGISFPRIAKHGDMFETSVELSRTEESNPPGWVVRKPARDIWSDDS